MGRGSEAPPRILIIAIACAAPPPVDCARHPSRGPDHVETPAENQVAPRSGDLAERRGGGALPALQPDSGRRDGAVQPHLGAGDGALAYERFARGRPGAIVVEATGIREVPSGPLLRIGDDRFIAGLARLTDAVKRASGGETRPFIQLIDFLAIRRRPEPEKF